MCAKLCGKSPISSAVLKGRHLFISANKGVMSTWTTMHCFRPLGTAIVCRKQWKRDVFVSGPVVHQKASLSMCNSTPIVQPRSSISTTNYQCNRSSSVLYNHLNYGKFLLCVRTTSSMSEVVKMCWNCSAEIERNAADFFCNKCSVLQPVIDDLNHFQRMQW